MRGLPQAAGAHSRCAPDRQLPGGVEGLRDAATRTPTRERWGPPAPSCHGTRAFALASFQHPRFPEFFAGKHAGLECAKCHKGAATLEPGQSPVSSRTYRGLSTECATCHKDAHLGQLGAQCAACHSVTAQTFKQVTFDHSRAEFPLTGKHATIECITCHKTETGEFPAGPGTAIRFKGTSGACITCHKDVHLGQLGDHCSECHRTDTFKLTSHGHRGDPDFFTGGHAAVECRSCHRTVEADFPAGHGEAIQFTNLDRQCATCHEDVHRATLGDDCASCHTVHAPFRDPSRAFHKSTMLPLEGRHLQVPCADCHWDGQIKGTPTRCYDCHWIRRQDDRYRTRLGNECEQCHRPISWTAVNWDHGVATGHALRGAHATLDCEACHVDGRFEGGLPTDCASCHLDDYQAADDPNHVAAGFPTTCDSCHSPSDSSWDQARFDHGSYPLVGAHAAQPCDACHSSGVYQGLPSECVDCHLDDYEGTEEPDHAAAGFPTTCDDCHNASDASWEQGHFDHGTYPLVGAHAAQPCDACHSSGVYQGLPSECVDCHLDDYEGTEEPDHAAAGFPTTCDDCHNASDASWEQGHFDHGTYPLVGAHAAQPCDACHSGGVYQGLPSECVDCHLQDYQEADEPDHVAAGFPTDCTQCHDAADPDWGDGEFGHDTYPLVGAHAAQPCDACHSSGVYQGLPSECVDCHLQDYQEADEPDHVAAGFPTDCAQCHDAADPSWGDGSFDHGTYPLVGAHAAQPCEACHSGGVYQGLPSECVDCHLEDYQGADGPGPRRRGLPDRLHPVPRRRRSELGRWRVRSRHVPTRRGPRGAALRCLPLRRRLPGPALRVRRLPPRGLPGGRRPGPRRRRLPHRLHPVPRRRRSELGRRRVRSRHLPTRRGPRGPALRGLPLRRRLPGTALRVRRLPPRRLPGGEDPDHVAAGFPTDCTQCHDAADPSWGDGEFGHDTYPLVGAHAAQPCEACHSGGVYQGLPSECVDCHLDDYQGTTDPDHVAAGFPTDCAQCHDPADPDWGDGIFDHGTYPLVGAHASQPCDACHSGGVYQGLPSECVDCHLDDYQGAENPDHVAAGFPTDCAQCHDPADPEWGDGIFDHGTYPLVGAHASQPCDACHSGGVYQGTAFRVRRLPPRRLPGHDRPGPRRRRLPHRLPALPRPGRSELG